MNTLRVFFAIEIPQSVKKLINDQIIMPLQEKHQPHVIRWTHFEHLHITLHFLPAIKVEDISALNYLIQEKLKWVRPVSIEFGKLELFPSATHPKIISLEIKGNTLIELVRAIGEAILAMHYSVETRPFRAHLTLGRFKSPFKTLNVDDVELPNLPSFLVSHIILFQSEPTSEGSHYTRLALIQLSEQS